MRIWLVLLISLLPYAPSVADPYSLFKDKGKTGLKDEAGKVIIPAAFEALGWSDGSFSVTGQVTGYKLKDQWGLINLKKQFLSKAEYEELTYPGGDRVVAKKRINPVESKWGCLNLQGAVAVAFRYDGIRIMGLRAIVFNKFGPNYEFGLIDLNDVEIIPLHFKSIYPLGTLRYAVENRDGKTALFSEQGKAITDFRIDSISAFRNNVAVIYQELKQGVIDRDGEIKIEPQYREVKIETDGSVESRIPDEWKVLSGENHEILKVEADQLVPIGKNLYRLSKGRRYGVVDEAFNKVIPVEYSYISEVRDGKIIAAKDGKYGILRLDGSMVIPFQYDSLVPDGKFIAVREDHLRKAAWSIYDTFGIQKTKKPYDYIGPFNGKFFPARSHDYWGAIDRYGEELIHCVFDSLLEISDDQVAVKFKGLYGIISINEDWLLGPQPDRIQLINSDRYLLHSANMVFLKDFSSNLIYFTDHKLECLKDCMKETLEDGSVKRIDYQGRMIEPVSLPVGEPSERVYPESEGLRGIFKDGKYGFVDDRGRLRIANRYEAIGSFIEGLAPVKIINKWGYIDASERIIIQPTFESAGEFTGGLALVKRAGKFGLIDSQGKQAIPLRYDSIVVLPNRNFQLFSDGQQGLADKNGQVLIDPRYESVEDLNNGYVLIRRAGKSGLLTLQGMSTIPLIYDQLIYDKGRNQYLGLISAGWKKRSIN